ncbi:MAG: hypothetical protein ACI9PP_002278 [Halobacteriales archaeon]|jgi:hypothetical protein
MGQVALPHDAAAGPSKPEVRAVVLSKLDLEPSDHLVVGATPAVTKASEVAGGNDNDNDDGDAGPRGIGRVFGHGWVFEDRKDEHEGGVAGDHRLYFRFLMHVSIARLFAIGHDWRGEEVSDPTPHWGVKHPMRWLRWIRWTSHSGGKNILVSLSQTNLLSRSRSETPSSDRGTDDERFFPGHCYLRVCRGTLNR